MAGPTGGPIPPNAQQIGPGIFKARGPYRAPFIYRFAGTALSASMWFFLMYRAKKDGNCPLDSSTSSQSNPTRPNFFTISLVLTCIRQALYCWAGSTLGITRWERMEEKHTSITAPTLPRQGCTWRLLGWARYGTAQMTLHICIDRLSAQ
ncbi:hypothetical protein MCOR27_002233 [Pyricularia oryzae]|nr:hypothetical protein MCOR01_006118 [Pyricularia oryzae]KAI6259838.1 hypothetical protein MCOR19_003864 [Pyricularia oryzae]KAI6285571.1 hypothetical protein MCOR27_002233 [Pyricularia oryzae]KAI6397211.1 hypothetical protein MCOR20_009625 [Pyricularia oryzae]KAI6402361.1 hypothetical protein MCOR24_008340 [Pyricularia oryzae]